MLAVLGVDAGQRPVPQLLQRRRAGRVPPGAGHRVSGHPVRPVPRHQRQVTQQRGDRLRVARAGHQGHQQHQPDHHRGRHRPPGGALDPAFKSGAGRDLIDDAGLAAQRVQPLLGHPQPHVISGMAGGLHPAVAADYRRRDRDRLAEHHQIPGPDRPRAGRHQRRPAIFPQALPGRGRQVRDPDSDHARPPEQLKPRLPARLAGTGRQAPRHARLTRRSSLAYQDVRHKP